MFDYSRMEGRFFEPDDKICLIFDNVYYDKLRELPEFAHRFEDDDPRQGTLRNDFVFADMPHAR